MFANYTGNVAGINEFNRMYHIIAASNVRQVVLRMTINNAEARLTSIIRRLAEGDDYDSRYLAAHRDEILLMRKTLDQIRAQINRPREAVDHVDMEEALRLQNHHFSSATHPMFQEAKIPAMALGGAVYGGVTAVTSGTATGISAVSFVAGLQVGIPVVATVGSVSAVATIGASIFGSYKGYKNAEQDATNSLRSEFGLPPAYSQ